MGRAKVVYRSRPPSMTARITRPRTPPMGYTLLLALWEPFVAPGRAPESAAPSSPQVNAFETVGREPLRSKR